MEKRFLNSRFVCSLGILLSLVLSLSGQNVEVSKNWLKEERKLQLKTNVILETEYLKISPKEDRYANYKTLYEVGKEKYSIDYLNASIKEELKYMPIGSPPPSYSGAAVIIGGLNLSNPKAWFTAAKFKKRKRKMLQITNYVYSID